MPNYGRGQRAPRHPKTFSRPTGGLTLTLTQRGCSPGILVTLPQYSDARTCSCSGGVHEPTSSGGLLSPPGRRCDYRRLGRVPLTTYYSRPLYSVCLTGESLHSLWGGILIEN